ncbi:MAG: carboxypeptidase regulatory-like domain-containing protein, partial [Gemmatimonadota bacterium]
GRRLALGAIGLVAAALVVAATAPGAAPADEGGVVRGVVRVGGAVVFAGTPPEPRSIDMSADPYCVEANPEPGLERPVAVGPEGGLANVVVFVQEGAPASSGTSASGGERAGEAVLDQSGCRYRPHVLTLRTGQTLVIRNSDGTLHNVHAHTTVNRGFNVGQPIRGIESRRSFPLAERPIAVRCDIHGWMKSYLLVFDHPFFAVTAEAGSFALPVLPPGEYVIEAWHETLGSENRRVTVRAGEDTRLDFTFGG